MDDHVVHKRTLRVQHGRVLTLPQFQPGGVIHGDVLNGVQGLRAVEADVAHVTDIKDTYAGPDGQVFLHQTAKPGVLDGHVPSTEIDHFCPQFAVEGV